MRSKFHQCRFAISVPFSFLITLMMAFVFLSSCQSSKPVRRTTESPKTGKSQVERTQPEKRPVPPTPAVTQNEDFDPQTLQAPEFRIPRKQVVRKSDTLSVAKISTPAQVDTSWQTVPGFQVQLLQTEDAKLARSTAHEAILALNVEMETIYEAPYYKIRAGRFVNRYDAEQLQNLASEKGYANCWVVRTQVKVRANEVFDQK